MPALRFFFRLNRRLVAAEATDMKTTFLVLAAALSAVLVFSLVAGRASEIVGNPAQWMAAAPILGAFVLGLRGVRASR